MGWVGLGLGLGFGDKGGELNFKRKNLELKLLDRRNVEVKMDRKEPHPVHGKSYSRYFSSTNRPSFTPN
jgi:hypothetical protein